MISMINEIQKELKIENPSIAAHMPQHNGPEAHGTHQAERP
jgi:hypothetical protein